MKRIITVGLVIAFMVISVGGCVKATGEGTKPETWRSDVQKGERGSPQPQGAGGGGFGVK